MQRDDAIGTFLRTLVAAALAVPFLTVAAAGTAFLGIGVSAATGDYSHCPSFNTPFNAVLATPPGRSASSGGWRLHGSGVQHNFAFHGLLFFAVLSFAAARELRLAFFAQHCRDELNVYATTEAFLVYARDHVAADIRFLDGPCLHEYQIANTIYWDAVANWNTAFGEACAPRPDASMRIGCGLRRQNERRRSTPTKCCLEKT